MSNRKPIESFDFYAFTEDEIQKSKKELNELKKKNQLFANQHTEDIKAIGRLSSNNMFLEEELDELKKCNKLLAEINLNNAGKIAELEEKQSLAENEMEEMRVLIHCYVKKFGFSDVTINLTQAINKSISAIKGDNNDR